MTVSRNVPTSSAPTLNHWWSLPSGPQRQAAKAFEELYRAAREGRRAMRRYSRKGDVGYFVGMDGERFEFPIADKDKQRAARFAARETFDKILRKHNDKNT